VVLEKFMKEDGKNYMAMPTHWGTKVFMKKKRSLPEAMKSFLKSAY
jgi:hypothetical protein